MLALKEVITTPSVRDLQVSLGASDVSDLCDNCLGAKMAGEKKHREFSAHPWYGTSIHRQFEYQANTFQHERGVNDLAHELFHNEGFKAEQHLKVADIPGYGEVFGSIDLTLEGEREIVDYKKSNMKKIRDYRANGIPMNYYGQMLLYLKGLLLKGVDVDQAVIVFVPIDSDDLRDWWAYEVKYNEADYQRLIDRAAVIAKWVAMGVWDQLPSDHNCFTCNPRPRFN